MKIFKSKGVLLSAVLLLLLVCVTACTAEQNVTNVVNPPGFWLGLWHGFILTFFFHRQSFY